MQIDGKTELIGLLGWPISHSKSPPMHNAAARVAGLNLCYVPLPVNPAAVKDALAGLPALGFKGVNVTVPHKQAVMPFLDEIDPAAAAIGAVNTIKISGRNENEGYAPHLSGYNTDWVGFRDDLVLNGIPFKGRDAIVLGAGGSARAIVYALLQAGCRVFLCARRQAQARTLIDALRPHFPAGKIMFMDIGHLDQATAKVESPLIVNTTPVGMVPHVERSVWPQGLHFPAGSFLYDLIYNPAETLLMTQARAAGCGVQNGLGMLVGQGAEAFRLWTGVEPDRNAMTQALS